MEGTTAISMVKGEKINLTKDNPGLSKLTAGFGWDINAGNASTFDLDGFAIQLVSGKFSGEAKHLCYFNNKSIAGCQLDKDNLTGEGEGDDEKIFLDLSAIPADVNEVLLGINIYQADMKKQNFGMVKNAFCRLFDTATPTKEYCKYDLSEDYSTATALIAAKLYRHDGEWKFAALGEGKNGAIVTIANGYK